VALMISSVEHRSWRRKNSRMEPRVKESLHDVDGDLRAEREAGAAGDEVGTNQVGYAAD